MEASSFIMFLHSDCFQCSLFVSTTSEGTSNKWHQLGVTCWFKAFLVLWYVVQWYVTHYTLWNIISLFNSASHCFGDLWGLLENLVINPNSRLFVWTMTSFPEFNWGQFLVIYFYRNCFLVVSSWQQTVVRLCFISMCVFCFYGF